MVGDGAAGAAPAHRPQARPLRPRDPRRHAARAGRLRGGGRHARRRATSRPILMLTAKSLPEDVVHGPGGGRRRLPAQALRPRRAPGAGQGPAAPAGLGARRRPASCRPRAIGEAEVDFRELRDPAGGETFRLTLLEAMLLKLLVQNAGRVVVARARSWRRSGTSRPTPRPARSTTSSSACAATSSPTPPSRHTS